MSRKLNIIFPFAMFYSVLVRGRAAPGYFTKLTHKTRPTYLRVDKTLPLVMNNDMILRCGVVAVLLALRSFYALKI